MAGIRNRRGRNFATIFFFAFISANIFSGQYLLAGAMGSADHTWDGRSFKDLAKWIDQYAPRQAYGNRENIEAWQRLTDEERRDIMIELRLRPSEFDILRGLAVS